MYWLSIKNNIKPRIKLDVPSVAIMVGKSEGRDQPGIDQTKQSSNYRCDGIHQKYISFSIARATSISWLHIVKIWQWL